MKLEEELIKPGDQFIKKTVSLCPVCSARIEAVIFHRDNKVYMRKKCPEHGVFEEIYWADYKLWKEYLKYDYVGDGLSNPRTKTIKGCPFDCGICPEHKSHTVLGIIDITNRCNMKCPICFANAARAGYVYEPSLEEIEEMIKNLRKNSPVSTTALQLSGGEPTVRDDLPEIIRTAKKHGLSHVEVNTNGIRFAKDIAFYHECFKAGMSTVYLQFDSLKPEVYEKLRGFNVLPYKLKLLENARKIKHGSIVLVVTLAKGVNDEEIGEIIRFAAENKDVIRAINVQPISFSGAAKKEEMKKMRITIPEFLKLVEKETNGKIKVSDFRAIPWALPVSKSVGALKNRRYPEFTNHPHCGAATFIVVEDNGEINPITKYVDVDKFHDILWDVYNLAIEGKKFKAKLNMLKIVKTVKGGLFRRFLLDILTSGTYEALAKLMNKLIMIGCMHFMDAWNFDLERVQRCTIHYATVDGRIIPFCTMNTLHREPYEKMYSVKPEIWLERNREKELTPSIT